MRPDCDSKASALIANETLKLQAVQEKDFVSCCFEEVSGDKQFRWQSDSFHLCWKRGQGTKWVSFGEQKQVTVITVKGVSRKKCRLSHSQLHYLSTCQSICLFASHCHQTDKPHLLQKLGHCAMCKSSSLSVAHFFCSFPIVLTFFIRF